MVKIKIEGVLKPEEEFGDAGSSVMKDYPLDYGIREVFEELAREGFRQPDYIAFGSHSYSKWPYVAARHPTTEIEVVTDRPSNHETGQINIDDTIIHFANLESDSSPLVAEIASLLPGGGGRDLVIDGTLKMTFHRTLRMPDDGKLHQLPQSLGTFPLFNMSAFSDRLPDHISEKGGVLFPMWQREAMWIQFDGGSRYAKKKYAIRLSVGQINAISGISMKELATKQDYVVVPGQPWLDGVAVSPGVVRQFVAMALGGGYTVEGQVTGEEKCGGLQIEVIPQYKKNNDRVFSHDSRTIRWEQTPRSYDLKGGDKITVAPNPPTFSRPAQIGDYSGVDKSSSIVESLVLTASYPSLAPEVDYLSRARSGADMVAGAPMSASGYYSRSSPPTSQQLGLAAGAKLIQDIYADTEPAHIWDKSRSRLINIHIFDSASFEAVTHIVPPPTPVTAKAYHDAGLPFFVIEEEVDGRVEGGESLAKLKSVSEIDKAKGVSDNEDTTFDPLKPKSCSCGTRLCDCIVRPCNHQFCHVCIKKLESQFDGWKCPNCSKKVKHVAGFSAPMNLPGEEAFKVNVPVVMLKVEDGRAVFESVVKTRM